jgi:UDP-N-acetylglucosamine enolpyruvyl transferase
VAELRKLGASIDLDEEDGLAIVNGPTTFKGADTNPDNIRAASCILLAGLACPEKPLSVMSTRSAEAISTSKTAFSRSVPA